MGAGYAAPRSACGSGGRRRRSSACWLVRGLAGLSSYTCWVGRVRDCACCDGVWVCIRMILSCVMHT